MSRCVGFSTRRGGETHTTRPERHITHRNTTAGAAAEADAWGMGVLHPFPNKVRYCFEQ